MKSGKKAIIILKGRKCFGHEYYGRMAALALSMAQAEGNNPMLKLSHDKIEDIPEAHRELYTEQDGKFILTGIEGVKTQGDVDRVMGGLTKERADHKVTKASLHVWDGLDHEEVTGKLDRFAELEVAAKGNKEEMDAKLEELTEARVKTRLSPVERENTTLKARVEELEGVTTTLQGEKTRRVITDSVRDASTKSKVVTEALPDVLMLSNQVFAVGEDGKTVLTKENPYGITPGLSPDVFLSEMQEKRPHWWPRSTGGGAGGSGGGFGGGENPWSNDHWNLTKQGAYVKEHGIEKAEQMAKTVGTSLGGARPVPKK